VFGVAVAAALVFVYAVVLGPTFAGTSPLLAGFEARSYVAGQTATLRITGGGTSKATLQLYLAGAPVESGTASLGWDRTTFGRAVTVPRQVRRPPVHGSCTFGSARAGRAATMSRASPGRVTPTMPRS
jgi:hypothetical protein